jgi:hypothetical protein
MDILMLSYPLCMGLPHSLFASEVQNKLFYQFVKSSVNSCFTISFIVLYSVYVKYLDKFRSEFLIPKQGQKVKSVHVRKHLVLEVHPHLLTSVL